MNQKSAEATEATVRALYDAFRERRRQDAEALLAASFTFTSPYDDKIGRATYFERCWPNGDNFAKLTRSRRYAPIVMVRLSRINVQTRRVNRSAIPST